jgi:hypothetical protein
MKITHDLLLDLSAIHATPVFAPPASAAQRVFERFVTDEGGLRDARLAEAQHILDTVFVPRARAAGADLSTLPSVYDIALIRYYTQEGFTINTVLTNHRVQRRGQESDLSYADYLDLAREIDRILPSLPSQYQERAIEAAQGHPITLYRGAEATDNHLKDIEVGPLSHPVPWSTTPDGGVALHFSGAYGGVNGNGYVYVLEGTNGTDVSAISSFPSEGEYMFPTNARFIVADIEWRWVNPDLSPYTPQVTKDETTGIWSRVQDAANAVYMAFVHIKPVN